MRKMGGMLFASAATVAIAAARYDGAASLLDEDPTPTPTPAATTEGDPTPTPTPAATGEPPAVPDWAKTFSADKTGDELSHQEWLAKKGFTDPNALVASYRQAEKAIREGGKIKIPGDGATADELAAFREAIGAPAEAKGYEITMPEGHEQFAIDESVIDPLREVALKHNVPAKAFDELAGVFLEKALEDAKAEVARTDTEAAEKVKEWGPKAAENKEAFRRGAQLLELTKADVAAIQREFGAGKTLDLFAKIGKLAGEDFFAAGNPQTRFGVANVEQAQKAVDSYINDPEKAAKIRAGDKGTIDGYNRAVEALAAFREMESKRPSQRG